MTGQRRPGHRTGGPEARPTHARRLGSALMAACAVWMAAGCAEPAPPEFTAAHRAAIEDSVRAMLQTYRETVNAGDWEGVTAYYGDDERFHWIEDGEVRYRTKEEVSQALASVGGFFTSVELTVNETRVTPLAPGIAHVATLFEQELVPAEGDPVRFSGALTLLALSTPDGWKLVAGHTSSLRERSQ